MEYFVGVALVFLLLLGVLKFLPKPFLAALYGTNKYDRDLREHVLSIERGGQVGIAISLLVLSIIWPVTILFLGIGVGLALTIGSAYLLVNKVLK